MAQNYPPPAPQQPLPQKKPSCLRRGCGVIAVVGGLAVLIGVIVGVTKGTKHDDTPAADSKPSATAPTTPGKATTKAATKPVPAKTIVQAFRDYVAKHGSPQEISASKHVTKIQGADGDTNLMDLADVYTNYTGDITSSDANHAKLIASSFADFQSSRGKKSANGLVTIYNANGDLLSNGNY